MPNTCQLSRWIIKYPAATGEFAGGQEIMLSLAALRVDYAAIACSAIDKDGRVMDFDLSKIAVKKAAMTSATHKFLLATPAKFRRTALSAFADLPDFDVVIDGTSSAS